MTYQSCFSGCLHHAYKISGVSLQWPVLYNLDYFNRSFNLVFKTTAYLPTVIFSISQTKISTIKLSKQFMIRTIRYGTMSINGTYICLLFVSRFFFLFWNNSIKWRKCISSFSICTFKIKAFKIHNFHTWNSIESVIEMWP